MFIRWAITLFKVRTAANLRVGLGELQNSCKTDTAGARSFAVVFFSWTIACAASYMTISDLWRRQLSMKSKSSLSDPASSFSISFAAIRIWKKDQEFISQMGWKFIYIVIKLKPNYFINLKTVCDDSWFFT